MSGGGFGGSGYMSPRISSPARDGPGNIAVNLTHIVFSKYGVLK